MSKIIILFLSVVFLSAAGSCDGAYSDWPEEQQKQYSKLLGLQIIDTAQTFQMINCQKHTACRLQELNPLLGSHPSKNEVLAMKVVGNLIIYKFLDEYSNGRDQKLRILNGVFTVVVINNGIQLTKRF